MFWIPLMMAGMSLMQNSQKNGEIKNQNRLNKSNTRIANIQQQGESTLSAARGALSRVTQANQTMEAQRQFGSQWNTLETSLSKIGEQMTRGTFTNRVNAAAQMGALQASASAAGIGGSTVDMLGSTMELQSAMQEEAIFREYSDNRFALEQDKQENLYGQYGILQQQDVFLDNVAAAPIIGPASIPRISSMSMAMEAGMAFLGAANKSGDLKEISAFGSKTKNTLKSWFSSGANKGAS